MRQTRVMCFLAIVVCLCADGTVAAEEGGKQIRLWIADLADKNAQKRDEATRGLIVAGTPAVAAVSRMVGSRDAEVDLRAKTILTAFLLTSSNRLSPVLDRKASPPGGAIWM